MPTRDPDDHASAGPPDRSRLLEAYFEQGLDGMVLSHSDGAILRANPAACALLGWSEAELQSLGRDGLVVPSPELDALMADRASGLQARGILTIRRADGTTFPAEVTSSLVRTGSGEACNVVVFRDVTAQRRAEERNGQAERSLRESEARYRSLFNAVPAGVVLTSMDGRILTFNDRAAAELGYTREEFARLALWEIDATEDEATVRARTARTLAEGQIEFDTRHRARTGETRDVHVEVVRIDLGGAPALLSVWGDLSSSRRLERELRLRLAERDERERWLQASQRVARLGHYVFEIAQDRWTSSEVLDELFGIGPEHPRTAATWLELIHPDDRESMAEYLGELLASGLRFDREYRVGREGDPPRFVHGLGNLHRDAGGRPVRLVGTIQDVTARHQADRAREALAEQLRQAQKLESIGRLAGGVAHDFNNILVVILSCVDALAQRREEGRPPDREELEELQAAAQRARDLTGQLLTFARKQVVVPVVLDLGAAVKGVERMLGRLLGEDVTLRLELEPALWSITADPGQLQQVLLNLAVNARDAMPAGGRLTISTANVSAPAPVEEGWIGPLLPPGRHVRLRVEDTGAGVPTELQPRLFEPFFTTKPPGQGTGLGLATVYGIVQQAGGTIRFRSAEGRGTTFELCWPCAAAAPVSAAEPVRAARPRLQSGERIMVVEDDDLVRQATTRLLRDAGYEVTPAEDGAQALTLLADGRPAPHLLLTDVVMPGMNGRQVADAVRQRYPAIRVLFMSGYAQDIIVHHGVVDPGFDLIEKPFTNTVLQSRVRAALDG